MENKTITIEVTKEDTYQTIARKFYDKFSETFPEDKFHSLEDGFTLVAEEEYKAKKEYQEKPSENTPAEE